MTELPPPPDPPEEPVAPEAGPDDPPPPSESRGGPLLPPPVPSAEGEGYVSPSAFPIPPPPPPAAERGPDVAGAAPGGVTVPLAVPVRTSRLKLATGTDAILARPRKGDATRGIVLLPDIGGLRPLFDDLCTHLAATHRWAVCAPEAWMGREGMPVGQRLERAGDLDDDVVLGDALAAAEETECEHVGVIGFCMGGMFALKASGIWRFDRVVSFYGMVRLPEAWRSKTLGEPLPVVEGLGPMDATERLLSIIGTEDPWVPKADADALEATGARVLRYEGADHGFVHDPQRAEHRPDDAADAWHRVIEFFET